MMKFVLHVIELDLNEEHGDLEFTDSIGGFFSTEEEAEDKFNSLRANEFGLLEHKIVFEDVPQWKIDLFYKPYEPLAENELPF